MKTLLSCLFIATSLVAGAQTHDLKPAEAIKNLAFMTGTWVGKQDFNTGGDPMVGEATNHIEEAIGGRYIEEHLSTALPGRKPSDTRHFLTYDPKTSTFKAWWFNDTSVAPMELEGTLTGTKLELTSKPTAGGAVLKATYEGTGKDKLVYKLEMKQEDKWQLLFTTTYSRKQ